VDIIQKGLTAMAPEEVWEAMKLIKLVLLGPPEEKKGGDKKIDPLDRNLACQAFEQVLLAVFIR